MVNSLHLHKVLFFLLHLIVGTAVVELAVGTVTVIVCDIVGNVVVEGARVLVVGDGSVVVEGVRVLVVGGGCVTVVVGAVLYNIKQRI